MEIDFKNLDGSTRYRMMTALIVPRPIAWISTLDAEGRTNLAPYSFFNALGNRPAIVGFGPGPRPDGRLKDTERAIKETGEFVLNLEEPDLAEAMHASAFDFAEGESEIEALGLETSPSVVVRAPRIKGARVHFECRYHSTVEIGDNHIVFGTLEHLHVPDEFLKDGKLDPSTGSYQPIGRLQGPGRYCKSADQFDLGRIQK